MRTFDSHPPSSVVHWVCHCAEVARAEFFQVSVLGCICGLHRSGTAGGFCLLVSAFSSVGCFFFFFFFFFVGVLCVAGRCSCNLKLIIFKPISRIDNLNIPGEIALR